MPAAVEVDWRCLDMASAAEEAAGMALGSSDEVLSAGAASGEVWSIGESRTVWKELKPLRLGISH